MCRCQSVVKRVLPENSVPDLVFSYISIVREAFDTGQDQMPESALSSQDKAKAPCFFHPIIEDVSRLQLHGLSDNGRSLKFSLSTIMADDLPAHLVGGFQFSFSNGFSCRRRYITYAERDLSIDLVKASPITIHHHDNLIRRVNVDPSESPRMNLFGRITVDSLASFLTVTSLPADIMHDFAEGACPMIIMEILKQASSLRMT